MNAETDALERAYRHALDYLGGLDVRSVAATTPPATLRARLSAPLPETGAPAGEVIDDLVAATRGGQMGSAGGRFFGWVIGGALPAALAADWLTSTWDENTTIAASGPAGAVFALHGVAALFVLIVTMIARGLQIILGPRLGLMAGLAVFVLLSFPSSGASFQGPMLPTFWHVLNRFWIGASASDAFRGIVYFGGQGVETDLLKPVSYTHLTLPTN